MYAQESFSPDSVQANANRVVRNGEPLFEVTAIGFVRATPKQAWSVLTDYERLADFVPDLISARLLSRSGNVARIENRSRAGFLLLSQVIRVVLQIEEDPYSTIDVALIEGDMKRYDTHWDLEPVSVHGRRGTRITFSGVLEPDFPVPPLFGRSILQSSLQKTLEAVVAEIERRNMH
ncbi:MAG TPA: SRPBCC family protein [Noviherbaspirillum sp.]|nr:SRPBCC family protein [Noviherbaspirillum sp.]